MSSVLPEALPGMLKDAEGPLQRLRGEAAATNERPRQARLLGEIGELEERVGDEPAAARDYLSAFNADPTFREPLEGLVRLLERRRSLKNLGRLVDALVRAAQTPDEKVRALAFRGTFAEDVSGDLDGAKASLRDATALDASPQELAIAWLATELVAAKSGDLELRLEALEKRATADGDPTWHGLLLTDVAKMAAAAGDVPRALRLLEQAGAKGAGATYVAAVTAERIARQAAADGASDAKDTHRDAYATALESQAELILTAIKEPQRGDELGVPRGVRASTFMADAWLRAADARRLAGDAKRAAEVLDRALQIASVDAPSVASGGPREASGTAMGQARAAVVSALLQARMKVAEAAGDAALAAQLAGSRLESEVDGGVAASLAMRMAEHAAGQGDANAALAALAKAVASDAACLPARALQLDLLADHGDSIRFASQLEAFAEVLTTDEARGRAFLLAAFAWGVQGSDVGLARAALTQASMHGVPVAVTARLARMAASIRGDAAWYEEATRRLATLGGTRPQRAGDADGQELAPGARDDGRSNDGAGATGELEPRERASLWFELARSRLARGDADGAAKALTELGDVPGAAWLGNVLDAFLPDTPRITAVPRDSSRDSRDSSAAAGETLADADPRRKAIERLAELEQRPEAARTLSVVAAARAHRAGDVEGARQRLRALASADPSDPLVTAYLAELERSGGARAAIADVLTSCAGVTDDHELATSLYLEAAFARWGAAERSAALDAFVNATSVALKDGPPKLALAWAARGVAGESLEARRRALDYAIEAGESEAHVALERFTAEVANGRGEEALAALVALEHGDDDEMALAGALARITWHDTSMQRSPELDGALSRVAGAGAIGAQIAAAEQLRLVRGGDMAGPIERADAGEALEAARRWLDAGGSVDATLEWLAASMSAGSFVEESGARRALAGLLPDDAREGREALRASAAIIDRLDGRGDGLLVEGTSDAVRIANVDLAPPGSDPKRRGEALRGLEGALGDEANLDALALSGWSFLKSGDTREALEIFEEVADARPADVPSWEGLRYSAEVLGDRERRSRAALELGRRCVDPARAAAFLEEAARLLLDLGRSDDAERAFEESFAKDARRAIAFDKLFRRVRERKDNEKLLALITRRIEVTDDPTELSKLFWEQARVLRGKGEIEGALKALENVVLIEPDHVGALALTGEIFIRQGSFEEAASSLSRLAGLSEAPAKNRLTAGMAAVDLYENKLDRYDRAMEVLLGLHRAKLSTLPVRERLARAAARTGTWSVATEILEQLMEERVEPAGRIEAARLAMAIHRDRVRNAQAADKAVTKLLDESPGDGEAIDLLLELQMHATTRQRLLMRARDALIAALRAQPLELQAARRLTRVARSLVDLEIEHVAIATAVALGGTDPASELAVAQLVARKPRFPTTVMSEAMLRALVAPGDEGPVAQLFQLLGPTLAEALGPSLLALGVTKKEKVDPKSGLAMRNEIAAWAGAFGISEFDLYIGGRDPQLVQGVPGDVPSLVVGGAIAAPLATFARARIARELFAMARGTTILRSRDETAVAAIVVSACKLAEVRIDAPAYAIQAEVDRTLSKAIARRTRKLLPDICRAIIASGTDGRAWSARAQASQTRAALVASGDIAQALGDAIGEVADHVRHVAKTDERVPELIRFAFSPSYLQIRRELGLEARR